METNNSNLKFKFDLQRFAAGDWTLRGATATYETEGGGRILVTGVTSTDGLTVSGNTVTVSKEALNGVSDPVKVSEGYYLALASDVPQPLGTNPSWSIQNGAVTYVSDETTSGYSLADNEIVYSGSKSRETVRIYGVNTSLVGGVPIGITHTGNTFKISNSILNGQDVRISPDDGYYLDLADDVSEPSSQAAGWVLNDDSTAVYYNSSTTEGYTLEDNEIKYHAGERKDSVVTVTGVKDADGLLLTDDDEEQVVTVYEDALNREDLTISSSGGKFKFEIDPGIEESKTTDGWVNENGNASYSTGGKTEGYKLTNDGTKIEYTEAVEGTNAVVLKGVDTQPKFADTNDLENGYIENDPESGIIELTHEDIDKDVDLLSNEGNYRFEIGESDEDFAGNSFTGSRGKDTITNYGDNITLNGDDGVDNINNSGQGVSINGGDGNDRIDNDGIGVTVNGGRGNDIITLNGGEDSDNTLIYKPGDGNDNVFDIGSSDSIKIDRSDDEDAIISAAIRNYDVIFRVNNGSITFKGAADENLEFTVTDQDGKAIEGVSGNTYSRDGVISDVQGRGRKILLSQTFSGTYTASEAIKRTGEVNIVDGSEVQRGFAINGGTDGQTLIGGVGKDTLISGEQRDNFSLKGGKGNDIFIYNGGKGIIADYSQKGADGKDKVVIAEELGSLTAYAVSGGNVTLNYGDENSLTLEVAQDKDITFGTSKSTVNTFRSDAIIGSNGKAATVEANQIKFEAVRENSKIETIDGSMSEVNVELIGNKKANLITAGETDTTLDGGKGKDTLVGGGGNDVFVYELKSGNKLIRNYDSDSDIISLVGGANIAEVKTGGSNLELKIGTNKVTIENGAGKSFTFNDGEEKTFSNGFLVSGGNATVTSSYTNRAINAGSFGYKGIDASQVKGTFTINGDETENTLIGSKGNDTLSGGGGGDTLWGGKGNDLLIGTADSADTFIFHAGEGTDTIRNFESSIDNLVIQDKRGRQDASFSSAFNSSNGTLTLSVKGGGKLILEGMESNGTVKINGADHQIIGKKLS